MNGRLKNLTMYVRSMGKALQVHAVFDSSEVDAANALMARDDSLAVVADSDGLILLADRHDQGEQIGGEA